MRRTRSQLASLLTALCGAAAIVPSCGESGSGETGGPPSIGDSHDSDQEQADSDANAPRESNSSFLAEVAWTGIIVKQACSERFSDFLYQHSISPSVYEHLSGDLLASQADAIWGQFFIASVGFPARWATDTRHVVHFYSPYSDVLLTAVYSPRSQRLIKIAAAPLEFTSVPLSPRDAETGNTDLLEYWRSRFDAIYTWASARQSPDGTAVGWSSKPERIQEALAAVASRIASLSIAGFDEPLPDSPAATFYRDLIEGSLNSLIAPLDDDESTDTSDLLDEMPGGLRSSLVPVYAEPTSEGHVVGFSSAVAPTFLLLAEFDSRSVLAVRAAVIGSAESNAGQTLPDARPGAAP